jgi:hypothetical protein
MRLLREDSGARYHTKSVSDTGTFTAAPSKHKNPNKRRIIITPKAAISLYLQVVTSIIQVLKKSKNPADYWLFKLPLFRGRLPTTDRAF